MAFRGWMFMSFRSAGLRTCTRCRRFSYNTHRNFSQTSEGTAEKSSAFGNALLIIPVTTFCLGTWQVKRKKWKLGLIKDLEERTTAPPIDHLPTDPVELQKLEYRRVKIRGTFDHSREIYVTPRSLYSPELSRKNESKGGMMSSSSNIGANVITPFYIPDLGISILVNRGWVARKFMQPESRPDGQKPPFSPDNDLSQNSWLYRDIPAMAEYGGTQPIFVDAVAECSVPGGPVGGQTRVTLRNEHTQYIITWYSLSALTALMWFFGVYKKKRPTKVPL
uniref:SURF1-like protein n=1 Tax=Saccoglossus kowalevskii TaxID=10224 RepID=A0ABM0MCI2_SACKO|nr:PREDICTED: surfeit locus protein 1-like isoform X2 [Saccoglossus kowalevskii]